MINANITIERTGHKLQYEEYCSTPSRQRQYKIYSFNQWKGRVG
jgi:hypothetical protein